MRYHNADGGEVEMCGNGARCFARYATRLTGNGTRDGMTFQTGAGLIRARFDGELVASGDEPADRRRGTRRTDRWTMARPWRGPISSTPAYPTWSRWWTTWKTVDVHPVGRAIRYHERFAPKGTNANFIEPYSMGEIILRTYERGVEGERPSPAARARRPAR